MLIGTFSTVYLACLKEDPSKCYALKHILETSVAWRIENELKCLTILRSVTVYFVILCVQTHTCTYKIANSHFETFIIEIWKSS